MSKNNNNIEKVNVAPIDNFFNKIDSLLTKSSTIEEIYNMIGWDGEKCEYTIVGIPSPINPEKPLAVKMEDIDSCLHTSSARDEISFNNIIFAMLTSSKISHELDAEKVAPVLEKLYAKFGEEMEVYNKDKRDNNKKWTFPQSKIEGAQDKAFPLRQIVRFSLLSGQPIGVIANKLAKHLDGNKMSIAGQANNYDTIMENIIYASRKSILTLVRSGDDLTEKHIKNMQIPPYKKYVKATAVDETFDL